MTGADPKAVPASDILAREAMVLLLWLVAREDGLIPRESAQHADALYIVRDPSAAYDLLVKRGLAADDASWYPTWSGGRALKDGSYAKILSHDALERGAVALNGGGR